jgi:hypothetical protein
MSARLVVVRCVGNSGLGLSIAAVAAVFSVAVIRNGDAPPLRVVTSTATAINTAAPWYAATATQPFLRRKC